MRRKERQLKVKQLFVLGAGASYSAAGGDKKKLKIDKEISENKKNVKLSFPPLDKDFCKYICKLETIYERPHWISESCKLIKEKWIDNKDINDCGLEEAVSRQLGNIDFLNAVYKERARTAIKSSDYLNHLTHVLVFLLARVHERGDFPYKQFSDKVFPTTFRQCENRVITFNYDDLLDKQLLKRFDKEYVYFDGIRNNSRPSPTQRPRRTTLSDFPLLIKLHGSINWRCHEKTFKSIIDNTAIKDIKHKDKSYIDIWKSDRGTKPDDNIAPLVIPPLPAKPLSSIDIFKWLWTKAFEYLSQAEEIIICGYSLPEIDQFARSLFTNFRSTRLKKVFVVDPNPSIMGKWREIFDRNYLPSSIQWEWADDFSDYVIHRL